MAKPLKTYHVKAVETIHHSWTVEAESEEAAHEIALEGCPDDNCCGHTEDIHIKEATS